MAMDPELKAKLLKRIGDKLEEDGGLVRDIEKGKWDVFYKTLKDICSDIWESIKDYASRIWNWVTDLFC